MVEFEFGGIKLETVVDNDYAEYHYSAKKLRTRAVREVRVYVSFWDFSIVNGYLHEIAFIKFVLQYFVHCYWRRRSGEAINLKKMLHHEQPYRDPKNTLNFVGRQKNKENYLHIFVMSKGVITNECYLDCQEVGTVEIALGKAISLMTAEELPRRW